MCGFGIRPVNGSFWATSSALLQIDQLLYLNLIDIAVALVRNAVYLESNMN